MVQSDPSRAEHSTASYSDYCDWGMLILKARTSLVAEKCLEIILDNGLGLSSVDSASSSSSLFPGFAGVVKARRLWTGASSSSELISLRLIKNQWLGITV